MLGQRGLPGPQGVPGSPGKRGPFGPPGLRVRQSLCMAIPRPQNNNIPYTKQTRDIAHVLVQCWASVADDGPTLNQHMAVARVCWDTSPNS